MTETFYPEIWGGERQARLLSAALVARGHEVTVVTRRSREGLPREQSVFTGAVGSVEDYHFSEEALADVVHTALDLP